MLFRNLPLIPARLKKLSPKTMEKRNIKTAKSNFFISSGREKK